MINEYKEYKNNKWVEFDNGGDRPFVCVGSKSEEEDTLISIITEYGYTKYDGFGDADEVYYHIPIDDFEEYKRFYKYFDKAMKKLNQNIR